MKYFNIGFLFLCFFAHSQNPAENLIPTNAATHVANMSGDWSDTTIWSTGSLPAEGAIVHIPAGVSLQYSQETSPHLFAIRVDGTLILSQPDVTKTTRLEFDTFYGSPSSHIEINASTAQDGNIEITITPFDILNHEATVLNGDTAWNTNAASHFNDGLDVNRIEREIILPKRFNTYQEAVSTYNGQSPFNETSNVLYNDGIGVLGRYEWDPMQMSVGMIIQGTFLVEGQAKTTYVQLAQDALRQQNQVVLSAAPENWNPGDQILLTKSGKLDATQNATEVITLDNFNGATTLVAASNLSKNHEGTPDPDFTLHCYAGNLTRNIVFKSGGDITNVHHRGHLMIMGANENIHIKNAQFKDMGRTDKSRMNDDLLFDEWRETEILKSKYSALGQRVATSYRPPHQDITNHRGRYSIHLHKNGSKPGDGLIEVQGNVVWGNPGWGITHHDAYADVSNNVVYDVLGAGIVAESGSETGFWNNNLVVDIEKRPGTGAITDPYTASLFYNDILFGGAGLGMKGRAVICNDNVIADINRGVSIFNMSANIGATDNVDPEQLATVRPNFNFDQFPLDSGGYSAEGNGIVPTEIALIMNNTTVISSNLGFRSIEREMGLNHESRSIFDGLILWGTKQGITNTYQADYTFHDVFISGDKTTSGTQSPTEGLYMWKHSHNHVYNNIKFRDLDNAVVPSKLVLSGNGEYKTRNNGFTPWIFIDAKIQNVGQFYEIIDEDNIVNPLYTEHSDNPIFFTTSEVMSNRETTFTPLDEASTGLPYYEIPGDLQFTFGALDYTETDPEKQFGFAIDGVITDKLGAYKFGVEQAAAQGSLRNCYPERLYQFASEAKFLEYLTANGVYENPTDGSLYFIINEWIPDRLTSEYTMFPVRITILNAPSSGIFANPQVEANFGCEPVNQLISRTATVSQSSTQSGIVVTFNGEDLPVDPNATKAIDGNNNGRDNAQFLQRFVTTGVPVGTYSLTEQENQPWYDLDFGEEATIKYIDIWNTVILNGSDIAPTNDDLNNFYVLLDDESFTGKTLDQALADANWSHHQVDPLSRKLSLDTEVDGVKGRYMRIQKTGSSTQLKLAEVEVLGAFNTDQVLPTVITQDITVQLDANGMATITADQINNGSTDNCAIDTLALDITEFTCDNVGANTVTLTVTDVNTNEATATAVVTVEDSLAPDVITQDITVQLDANGMASITADQIDNGSTDNCAVDTLALDITEFTCDNVGANTVTLTVTDVNTNEATATATVTVEDSLAPDVITQDIAVQLNANGMATITADQIDNGSTDNCAVDTLALDITEFTCDNVGANTVTLTVTDVNTNEATATAVVTVEDSLAPDVITQDITVQLDANGTATITPDQIDNGSTDNCAVDTLALDITEFTCENVGANTVTLTVTDVNTNETTATATVTVEDSLAPEVFTQDITVQLDANGMATITPDQIDNGSTDNCAVDTLSLDITQFTCDDVGANTVTLAVTDVNTNETASTATVTVEDSLTPDVITQDITVQLDANGMATITPDQIDSGSTDNCAVDTLALDITQFTCDDVGANMVTLTVTDVNTNEATATAVVTVEDSLAPEISCPSDTVIETDQTSYQIPDYWVDGLATAQDNCTNPVNILTQVPAPGTELIAGIYTVTLTAEDEFNNVETCSFELTVDTTLSTSDLSETGNSLIMIPNPAENKITISSLNKILLSEIVIYDLRGRLVKKKQVNKTALSTISIDDLESSVYLVLVTDTEGRQSLKRLIKQ